MSLSLKSLDRRRLLMVAGSSVASLAVPDSMAKQKPDVWPQKPVKIVVGFPSGSSPDMLARLIAEPLSKSLGQPVIVENKPGASGNVGADAIAKANDGYTIGIVGNGPLTSSKFLFEKLAYNPTADFAPVSLIGTSPLILVVGAADGKNSPSEILKKLKADGDKISYGSVGAGSGTHLGMELINEKLGLKAVHVPFPGGAQVASAIAGGHVQLGLLPPSTATPMIQSGKIVAVGITSAARSPLAVGVPTLQELGAQDFNLEVWNAFVTPAGFEPASKAALEAALIPILTSREIRQKLLVQGWKDAEMGPMALTKRIRSDTELYRKIIAAKGIRL
jgi:tripartite-type tricarboxylate transporter receptor subunit TctC